MVSRFRLTRWLPCVALLALLTGMIGPGVPVLSETTMPETPASLPAESTASVTPPPAEAAQRFELVHDGLLRQYLVHRPPASPHRGKVPVVLAFHGLRMTAESMMTYTRLNELADRQGFLVVYPQALPVAWRVYSVEGPRGDTTDQDIRFIRAMLDDLQGRLPDVDPARIYATGFSNGGFFTQRLACELPDRIAAFASVASTIGIPLTQACATTRPVPLLMLNMARDQVVIPTGSGRGLGIPLIGVTRIVPLKKTGQFWAQHNGCDSVAHVYHSGPFQTTRYPGCPATARVLQLQLDHGGHVWPGAQELNTTAHGVRGFLVRQVLGSPTQDLSANETIWAFFRDQRLPESSAR